MPEESGRDDCVQEHMPSVSYLQNAGRNTNQNKKRTYLTATAISMPSSESWKSGTVDQTALLTIEVGGRFIVNFQDHGQMMPLRSEHSPRMSRRVSFDKNSSPVFFTLLIEDSSKGNQTSRPFKSIPELSLHIRAMASFARDSDLQPRYTFAPRRASCKAV